MTKFLKSLWQDEAGATAIEYGLLAALIAVAIITTVSLLRGRHPARRCQQADHAGCAGLSAFGRQD